MPRGKHVTRGCATLAMESARAAVPGTRASQLHRHQSFREMLGNDETRPSGAIRAGVRLQIEGVAAKGVSRNMYLGL